jgi:Flp pilus assembly protein TadG
MMRELFWDKSRVRIRRGIAAIMFGLLLPVILAIMSLALDVAVVAVARGQLSTAADAASLAGAMKLASENRVRGATQLSVEISAANAKAVALAQGNKVLNVAPVLLENPNNMDGVGDVTVGYLDPDDPASPLRSGSAYTTQFNSVQAVLRRNATHVAPVPTIFGRLMGFNGTDVTVQSTATAQNYSIKGFSPVNNVLNASLLPIVLYVENYNQMLAGTTHDDYSYDPATNRVTGGSDNIHESLLYPVSNDSAGNWGTINVGVTNNSTSTLGDQIQNGITSAQLAAFPSSTIALNSSLNPPSITFTGNTGVSSDISNALVGIIGKPVVIPIYDQVGDNGNNAWYRVIKFQACRIVAVNFQGTSKYVVVQPCLINDPTAIPGPPAEEWTEGGVVRIHLSR